MLLMYKFNLLTEYLLLNWKPGTISIAYKGNNAVFRCGILLGFTTSLSTAKSLIRIIRNKSRIQVIVLRPVELIPPSLLFDKEILETSIDWNCSKYSLFVEQIMKLWATFPIDYIRNCNKQQ